MVRIHALWLAILLSSVFVFVASFLVHMVFKYHKNDMRRLPDEDGFLAAIRKLNIPAGHYAAPFAGGSKEMSSPEFKEKFKQGPIVGMTLSPGGAFSLGTNLAQWFVYTLFIGVVCAYVAGRALGPGAPYLSVFRFVGVTAFACYTIAGWQESIWFKRSWMMTIRNTFDGLVYACLTAGTFGWLWPQ